MPLTSADLVKMIPHGASMCMIDEVLTWDGQMIHCRSRAPAGRHNPLVENQQLHSLLLIEYGAQAAAIHAALLSSGLGKCRPAYIGAVRSVEFMTDYLTGDDEILIEASCQLSSNEGAIYDIEARQADHIVLRSRLILNQPLV